MLDLAEILFEDGVILVLDKKPNVVVNRSATVKQQTLQDDLAKYFGLTKNEPGVGDRAGIVHRLDRETSGLMVVAKTKAAFENLQAQFKERKVKKEYAALVHGKIGIDRGEIEAAIGRVGGFGKFGIVGGGREARTDFVVEERFKIKEDRLNVILSGSEGSGKDSSSSTQNDSGANLTKSRVNYLKNHALEYTYVTLLPKTGRTHQIRVHLKSIGHPLVSDAIYAPSKLLKLDLLWCKRLFLHAKSLEFSHPETNKRIFFESSLPGDLKQALGHLTVDPSTSLRASN